MTHDILKTADSLISGDRNASYGDYSDEAARIAAIWTVILGTEVKPYQVPLCMIGLKLARQSVNHKTDNLVDAAGYAALASDVESAHAR